jgi:hypothetical protein
MGDELVQETMGKMNAATKDWFSINPLRPGVGFLEVNTTEQNTLQDMKVDTIVDEARWSVSKNESTLQQINGTMQSNPAMAQSFDPMTLIDLLPLPFSQKEKAKARTMELMQQQMALEQAKAQKPPSLSASVSDVQYLSPMAAVQLLAMFGIQVPPEASQSPADAASYLTSEIAKAKAEQELRHKEETHQIDVEAKSQDMVIKATEGEQKLAHGERTMAFKERQGEKKREGA